MPIRRFDHIEIDEYKKSLNFTLTTTRFTTETWNENQAFINKKNKPQFKCIYDTLKPIANEVKSESDVLVLEMNNDLNQINGIGLITNNIYFGKYRIHENPRFSAYTYVGNERIDRKDFTIEEETRMRVVENLCFKGKRHQKRMGGITRFPIDMLYNLSTYGNMDLVEYIETMFTMRRGSVEKTV